MKLDELAVTLEMDTSEGVPFEIFGGYKIQLAEIKQGMVTFLTAVIVTNKKLNKVIIRDIQKACGLKGMLIKSVGLVDNAICMVLPKKPRLDQMHMRAQKVINVLKKYDIGDLDYCPFCGSGDAIDDYPVIEGVKIGVHQACINQFIEEAEMKLSKHESNPNYIKGFGYALVGAILGALPSFIIMVALNFMSAWLFVLIPMLSFYFYKKSFAAKTTITVVMISLVSLVVALGTMLLFYYLLLATEGLTFHQLLNSDAAVDFYRDLGLTALFSIIGIAFVGQNIYKSTTDSTRKKLAQFKRK